MSRSKKKPYYTDQNSGKPGRSKEAKRIASKAVRNAGKKAIKEPAYDTADGKAYRKESSSWDIRDWSFHSPKDKKAYRK
ncbi:MAG TPA: hypothetical protein VIJ14_09955 [Rhabdochlamydiaceae bacterium]